MNRWTRARELSATPTALVGSLALLLMFSYLMNAPGLSTSGAEFERLAQSPTFDFQFGGYDSASFAHTLGFAHEEGRAIYRNFMWLDVLFPAIYAAFWLGVFERARRAWGGVWRWIVFIPVVTALVDYAENLFVAIGFNEWPGEAPAAVRAASLSTQLKGGMTALLLLCAVAALARALFSVVATRRR